MQKNYSVIKWVVALAIIASGWGITSRLKTPLFLAGMPAREGLGVPAGSVADAAALRMPKLRIRLATDINQRNGTRFHCWSMSQNLIHTSTPEQMISISRPREPISILPGSLSTPLVAAIHQGSPLLIRLMLAVIRCY
jgi:hypothetical protein